MTDKPNTVGLKEQLSALPPNERMRSALENQQLEVHQLFYNVFPGCPTDFTRFAFFQKQELHDEERGWNEMARDGNGGLAPLFRERAFIANKNVGSVSREELEQYLTEQHQTILRSIKEQQHGIQDGARNLRDVVHGAARSYTWLGKQLWRRSSMATLQSVCDSLGDIDDRANAAWIELEPAVFKHAIGAGSEVTQEMVDSKFDGLKRELATKEAEVQKITGKLPQAGEDIEEPA